MLNTVIVIGILIGVVIIDKAMSKKPVPVKRSAYVPVGLAEDGTIICEKKINTWG